MDRYCWYGQISLYIESIREYRKIELLTKIEKQNKSQHVVIEINKVANFLCLQNWVKNRLTTMFTMIFFPCVLSNGNLSNGTETSTKYCHNVTKLNNTLLQCLQELPLIEPSFTELQ